jgi:hypothetical protein
MASVAVLATLSCSDSNAPTTSFPTVCTITLSGAITQTLTCSNYVVSTYSTTDDTARISGNVNGTPALSVNFRKKGSAGFAVGTYTQTGASPIGFVSASNASSGWIAAGSGITGAAVQGTWTLQLTSVTDSTTATGKVQKLHGQIDATMPSASGGGAALTAKVTF